MHHIQSIILSFLFTHLFVFSKAQTVGFGGWIMVLNSYKINNSLTAYFDGQYRTNNQFKNLQTLILRPGLQYTLRKNINATLGYAFIENRRTMGGLSGYAPEHRIWEQLHVMHRVGFTSLNHRLRLEQRFITKTTVYNNSLHHGDITSANRFRYFFRDIIPFSGIRSFKRGAFAALQNEIFINIGDKSSVNGKYFDQNRAYGALGYRFSPKFDLEAGYLNQYISGQNKSFTNNHNIQVASYIRLQ
jgi:hypothetical protein